MTRNRFNQAKNQSGNSLLGLTSTNNLTLSKARGLFLEDNDNIDMKDAYKITNVHPNNYNMKDTYKITNVHPNNPDKVKYTFNFKNIKPKFKVGDYVRNADKRNIFSKSYTSNWNRELFKVNEVLKTQPPTYKIEDINGEIIEGKYYEQELLKSEFDFESNNKVLESLNIDIS